MARVTDTDPNADDADTDESAVALGEFEHPVDLVLGPDGVLAQCIPHYEDRPAQRFMAYAIDDAIQGDDVLLAEAGTGTGKTLAYLVPALLSGRQVVVSTGTRALQDQISQRDLPLLEEIIARRFDAVVLKGVSNYLCLRKLYHGEARAAITDERMRGDYERIATWAKDTASGDRVEVEDVAEDAAIWRHVTTTPDTRIGPRCPFYERCFVTRARRRAEKADIIIVNHHLFFADLALRSGAPGARVLPGYDAVIFDEAHQLEDVMTEHFGVQVSTATADLLARDARHAFADPGGPLSGAASGEPRAWERLTANLEQCARSFFQAVRDALAEHTARAESGRFAIDEQLLASEACQHTWLRFDSALDALRAHAALAADELADPATVAELVRLAGTIPSDAASDLDQRDDDANDLDRIDDAASDSALDRLDDAASDSAQTDLTGDSAHSTPSVSGASEAAPGLDLTATTTGTTNTNDISAHVDQRAELLSTIARRAATMRDALAVVAERSERAFVYWGERRQGALSLSASPVNVAPYMREHVIEQISAAVFTSATLRADQRFDYVRQRLGLDEDVADAIAVPSPFDYSRQALLYLPRDLPDPRDPEFITAACERIRALCAITDGRAFVLFTSHRALREAARQLAAPPADDTEQTPLGPLLIQGDMPRAALIERFRARPGSVLLGTGTFWEGVDVPGDALSLVIIDKLPFAPHTDPLVRARMQHVGSADGDPFEDYQLPQAALALKQGFGRLIRRSDDYGIVAVLDPRVVTRRYGRVFINTLPEELARTSAIEQVRRWWQSRARR